MIRLALPLCAALLLTGCIEKIAESRVKSALLDAGLSERNSSCMAERMVDRLSISQLRKLENLKPRKGEPVKLEAGAGPLPTRDAVWTWVIEQAKDDPYRKEVLEAFQEAAKGAYPVPQSPSWIEISNAVYPELQAAILGDKTTQQALDDAAAKATAILEDAGEL